MRLRREDQRKDAQRQKASDASSLFGLHNMQHGISVLRHVRSFAGIDSLRFVVAHDQITDQRRRPRRLADGAFGEPVVGALGTAFGAREVGHGVR